MPTDEGLMILIEDGHIPYSDREKYGYASHDVVPFCRLVDVIAEELLRNGRFPRRREKYDNAEGMWITKDEHGFTVWMSRANAVLPNVVAEKSEKHFSAPEVAARFYLKWECQLPGCLDGVQFT